MRQLKGCGTALVTPFDKQGAIDCRVFKSLVKRQLDAGIDFLVPLGTTGEAACLSDDEKMKLVKITVEEVAGKIPVIVGAGSNSTKSVIENIKLFEPLGVDGFLIVTPYYNKPTQTGLYNHFKTIAATTVKPIILYNVPSRTAVNLSAETCLQLAEIKNIVAIKEASSNYAQISKIIKNAPPHFVVFSGNDNETLALMATGAKGVISVVANIAPQAMCDFTKLLLLNDFVAGCKLHHKLSDLFANCFIETNPIPVKAGMHKMSLIENVLHPPLYAATEETMAIMTKTIQELNLL
ncbi:4-hydroxy-tetrahydrodipicolinate synthase [Gammaproteobacteria bacterium]